MLKVGAISKNFEVEKQKIRALSSISFEVKNGEFFSILGPSGCGKSTLLRILANLTNHTSGQISWEKNPKIGFVFQNYALLPFLTVAQNIGFGLKMQSIDKNIIKQRADQLIEEVGLVGFADKHPKELSGGMKQRVGIARALAIEPNVLLLDEPFSSLDELTADSLRKLLLSIWQKRQITVVMVTHLITEAIELSDRIMVMAQSGTIKRIEDNPLPRPRDLRNKEFFKLEDQLVGLLR